MSQVTIYGSPISTYVRTVRLICEEKGVSYELKDFGGSDAHARLHPYGKMPAFAHGDFQLYESIAIGRYIDRVFGGSKLWPDDAKQAAQVDQWWSVAASYVYPTVITDCVLMRFGMRPTDEAILSGVPARIEKVLRPIAVQLEKGSHLVGSQLTAADLVLAPIVFYLKMVPEAKVLEGLGPLTRWYDAVAARPSFATTAPKLPG